MSKRAFLKKCTHLFLIGIGSLILTLFFSQVSFSETVRGVTDTTIKIGAILDMTGPLATATSILAEAKRNYTRYINDKGGIHGRKVKLLVEDDRYSIPTGIAAFKKLVFKDEVFALSGPYCTPTLKALFDQMERLKIPMIGFLPQPIMVDPFKRYMFTTGEFYDDDMGVIFEYIMNEHKPKDMKMAFITFDGESGREVLKSVNKFARFFNYKDPIHREIIPLGAIEASSQVILMKREGITHILLHHMSPVAALLLRELRKFGLTTPVFGNILSCSEDVIKLAGDASKNYIGGHGVSSWYDDNPGMKNVREITLKYHPGTDKPWRSKYYTAGWVVMMLFHEGMARAGRDLTPDSCVQGLESIKDFDTQGLCGLITFSPTNHKGSSSCRLFKADPTSGKLLPITGWRNPPKF